MVTITTTNYKGKKFSGKWNEKVYASQIDDRPELKRIYIDNERIHITEEEYARLIGGEKKLKEEQRANKINDLEKEIKSLNIADRVRLALFALNDEKIKTLFNIDEEGNEKIFWDFENKAENLLNEEKDKKIYKGDLTRIANKLLARKDMENEYIAEYEGVEISSKEIKTISGAFKKVYGMTRKEYLEKNGKDN